MKKNQVRADDGSELFRIALRLVTACCIAIEENDERSPPPDVQLNWAVERTCAAAWKQAEPLARRHLRRDRLKVREQIEVALAFDHYYVRYELDLRRRIFQDVEDRSKEVGLLRVMGSEASVG